MDIREFQSGDFVELRHESPRDDLTPGKKYEVIERVYVGGHADTYVLRIKDDKGRFIDQQEDWFKRAVNASNASEYKC